MKLLVLITAEDASPTILAEAMACGSLALATPIGAITDLLKNGETGCLLRNTEPRS